MIRGLYAITPACEDKMLLEEMVEAAILGGANTIQYRSKSRDSGMKLEQAGILRRLCKKHSVTFIVNDDISLALEVDADGVHVGSKDGPVGMARKRLESRILGVSCYGSMELASEAQNLGADYVAFGSFYASTTKPDAAGAPLSLLQTAKLSIKIPVVAIGGITPENGKVLVEQGADALAVIASLFDAPDICTAAGQFSELFRQK